MSLTSEKPVNVELDGLSFLWLEITGKCNLTCTHCYADSGPSGSLRGVMSVGAWIRVIDEAAEIGCRELQFIGGEPTLHPELERLIAHARAREFTFVEVYTNATQLSAGLIQCLRENYVHVAASFYSDDSEVHDRITRRQGSWRQTLAGFEAILGAGLPLRVGIVEMEENAGHEPRTRELLRSLGVRTISSDRMRGVGRGDRLAIGEPTERFEELCGECWQGKLCVTPSGEAFPCVFARATPVGNAKDGLATIIQGIKLRAFREAMLAMRPEPAGADVTMPDAELKAALTQAKGKKMFLEGTGAAAPRAPAADAEQEEAAAVDAEQEEAPSLNLAAWQAARQTAINELKALASKIAATKHGEAAGALKEINAIMTKLPLKLAPQEIDKLGAFITQDEAITAAEASPKDFHHLHIRKPLLEALESLKQ
jgi:MoaA/NifB/PqqE/SkfB family radical SAM enzyme